MNTAEEALAFVASIEYAEEELLSEGMGGYQWEHLGDASKDIHLLMEYVKKLAKRDVWFASEDGFDIMARPKPSLHQRVAAEERTYVYLQWKGTDVCLDFWCECGFTGHYDGYFASILQCPHCKKMWEAPTFAAYPEMPRDQMGDPKLKYPVVVVAAD